MDGKPFAIVGVNSDDEIETALTACRKKDLRWRSFVNEQGKSAKSISAQWRVTKWPSTFLIDGKGVIRYFDLRGEALDSAIEVLLAELGEEVEIAGVDHDAEDEKAMREFEKAAGAENSSIGE